MCDFALLFAYVQMATNDGDRDHNREGGEENMVEATLDKLLK